MHKIDHTIPPKDALEKGRYLWAPRKERSDKMDERVMGLARRFWHSDDISRASGDSVFYLRSNTHVDHVPAHSTLGNEAFFSQSRATYEGFRLRRFTGLGFQEIKLGQCGRRHPEWEEDKATDFQHKA
ncbi:unnamed protein product [Ectocarpus sp. 13 AM-2016]